MIDYLVIGIEETSHDCLESRSHRVFGQSRIDSLHAGDGNDLVDIRQMARIDTIQLGQGMDTLETGQRYIDYVGSYEGMVHLDVGTGGIGSVALGDSTLGDHMVTTRGYIDQFRVNSQSTTHVTLDDTGAGGPINDWCTGAGATCPVSPPSYQPNDLLSAFNGEDMAGTWRPL